MAGAGMAQDIFVLDAPACAGERLLSYSYYQVSPRREAFFSRMKWVIDLVRGLHQHIISKAKTATKRSDGPPWIPQGPVYYVPSFFALLIAIHDEESLRCLVEASVALTSSHLYWPSLRFSVIWATIISMCTAWMPGIGPDVEEYPLVTDFDFAFGRPRPREEATLWMVRAFYASTRNMVTLTTGELSEGPGAWALAANLYSARRMVNVPFMLHEDCEEEKEDVRKTRLSFAGSVQATNHERVLLLRAAAAEFPVVRSGNLWSVKSSKLQLRVWVQLNATAEPLNHTQRLRMQTQRNWLQKMYRHSHLCIVAPGDAPALGQRLSDVLAAGCVPVVLLSPGTQPVLPLQGAIPWEDFAVLVRLGDDVAGTRWALRRLWAMSLQEIRRRQQHLLFWRPHLATSFAPKCSSRLPPTPPNGLPAKNATCSWLVSRVRSRFTLAMAPLGEAASPDAKSHALSRTERRKLKEQARADALQPLQQKLQSQDIRCSPLSGVYQFRCLVADSMATYLLAVLGTAVMTNQLSLLLRGTGLVSEGQSWVVLAMFAGTAMMKVVPGVIASVGLNAFYLYFCLICIAYVSRYSVPAQSFALFSLTATIFVRMPAVLFATRFSVVVFANALSLVHAVSRVLTDDFVDGGLIDSYNTKICMEVFQVRYSNMDGQQYNLLGLRDFTETWLEHDVKSLAGENAADAITELDIAVSPSQSVSVYMSESISEYEGSPEMSQFDSESEALGLDVSPRDTANILSNYAAQENHVGSKKEKDIYLDIDVEGLLVHAASSPLMDLTGKSLREVFPSPHTWLLLQSLHSEAKLSLGSFDRVLMYKDLPFTGLRPGKISGTMHVTKTLGDT
eukprot:s120_g33.t4